MFFRIGKILYIYGCRRKFVAAVKECTEIYDRFYFLTPHYPQKSIICVHAIVYRVWDVEEVDNGDLPQTPPSSSSPRSSSSSSPSSSSSSSSMVYFKLTISKYDLVTFPKKEGKK